METKDSQENEVDGLLLKNLQNNYHWKLDPCIRNVIIKIDIS